MSSLPSQAVAEFQALWKKHYGVALPREQASERALQVFYLMRLLLKEPSPTARHALLDHATDEVR